MNKKIILALSLCASVATVSAQSDGVKKEDNKELSKWSFALKGGANTLRGMQYSKTLDRPVNLDLGLELERTFNPLFGIGFEYLYQNNNNRYFDSNINNTTLYGSLNLTNIVGAYRSGNWQKFNAYMNAGGGLGFSAWKYNGTKSKDIQTSLAAFMGLNLEYNVSDRCAIGIEGQYRWNSSAEYNPAPYRGRKDLYATHLSLRWKLGNKENHVRNTSVTDWVIANTKVDSTLYKDHTTLKKRVINLEKDVAKLYNMKQEKASGGGSYANSDLEAKVEKNSKDIQEVKQTVENYFGEKQNVVLTFKHGSYTLSKESKKELNYIIELMKKSPMAKLRLEGHADNVGKEPYNQKLSELRATSIRTYMMEKGINSARVKIQGFGSRRPIASNATLEGRNQNRRVEMFLIK